LWVGDQGNLALGQPGLEQVRPIPGHGHANINQVKAGGHEDHRALGEEALQLAPGGGGGLAVELGADTRVHYAGLRRDLAFIHGLRPGGADSDQ
jgi:hypothetical protein